jgi:hypothetical protein
VHCPGNTTADPESLAEVLTTYVAENVSIFDLHTYDAVWASAIGAADAAATNLDKTRPPSGKDIMLRIAQGEVPGFRGAAGFHKFLSNGDPDMNFTQVQITNYQVQLGVSQGEQAVVGWVDLNDAGVVVLSDVDQISWPSGKRYPHVSKLPSVPDCFKRARNCGFCPWKHAIVPRILCPPWLVPPCSRSEAAGVSSLASSMQVPRRMPDDCAAMELPPRRSLRMVPPKKTKLS